VIEINTSKPTIQIRTPISVKLLRIELNKEYYKAVKKYINFEESVFVLQSIRLVTGRDNELHISIDCPINLRTVDLLSDQILDFDGFIYAKIVEE
jgi:hypothetical protein